MVSSGRPLASAITQTVSSLPAVLLQFINKNLSWGVFRRAINKWQPDYAAVFEEILGCRPGDPKLLEIEVYTILELVGSSCYSVILNGDPMGLDACLPYLHRSVRAIPDSFQARPEADERPGAV